LDYENTYIVINAFTVNEDGEDIHFEKKSLWKLAQKYCEEDQQLDEWVFIKFDDDDYMERFIVPIALIRQNIRHYWTYYQEQFDHLDKDKNYFGQINVAMEPYFSIIENGEKIFYRKIDEYTDSNGKKYNAFKCLNNKFDSYFSVDNIKYYADKEFLYFEPNLEINVNCRHVGKKQFYPPVPTEVNEYFLLYPKMLDVIDYGFRKIPLTPELQKVNDDYCRYKCDKEQYYQSPESMLITQVKPKLEEQAREEDEARIMAEINRETEQFRRELIRVRLKR
jgi:hypothetical protein